jgi:hypothetical protein
MNAITKRPYGLLIVAALALGMATGSGCKRADDTSNTGNPSGAAPSSGATGANGAAVAPAPPPPHAASQ